MSFVLVLFAIGLFVLLLKLTGKSRWIVVVLATLVVLPVFGLLVSRRHAARHVERDRVAAQVARARAATEAKRRSGATWRQTDGGNAWWPEAVEIHKARCYPSPVDAAQALAHDIATLLQPAASETDKGTAVYIHGLAMPHRDRRRILDEVARVLRQGLNLGEVTVVDSDRGDAPDDADTTITVGMRVDDSHPARWANKGKSFRLRPRMMVRRDGQQQRTDVQYAVVRPNVESAEELVGRLEADVRHHGVQDRLSISFIDKPWVQRFAEFSSALSGRHFVLARSASLAISQHDARQQALWAAADQLAPRVHARVVQMARGRRTPPLAIRNQLLLEMNEKEHIVDEFPQALETSSGGPVWRHAILLEFTPADSANSALALVNYGRQLRSRQFSTMASLIGLIVLTCVVYVFLNVATKGYYREALLGATVAVVVIGGAVLLLVA